MKPWAPIALRICSYLMTLAVLGGLGGWWAGLASYEFGYGDHHYILLALAVALYGSGFFISVRLSKECATRNQRFLAGPLTAMLIPLVFAGSAFPLGRTHQWDRLVAPFIEFQTSPPSVVVYGEDGSVGFV
jgi:hypothetical protein